VDGRVLLEKRVHGGTCFCALKELHLVEPLAIE
jgi:hypothetical protein